MSIIQCIYWLVGVDVILMNKNGKQIYEVKGKIILKIFDKMITVMSRPKRRICTEWIRRNEF